MKNTPPKKEGSAKQPTNGKHESSKKEGDKWLEELEASASSPAAVSFGSRNRQLSGNDAVSRSIANTIGRLKQAPTTANFEEIVPEMPDDIAAIPYTGLSLFDYLDDLCKLTQYIQAPNGSIGPRPEQKSSEVDHETLSYPMVRSQYEPANYPDRANPNYQLLTTAVDNENSCTTGPESNRRLYEAILECSNFRAMTRSDEPTYVIRGQDMFYLGVRDLSTTIPSMESAVYAEMATYYAESDTLPTGEVIEFSPDIIERFSHNLNTRQLSENELFVLSREVRNYKEQLGAVQLMQQQHMAAVRLQAVHLQEADKQWFTIYFEELKTLTAKLLQIVTELEQHTNKTEVPLNFADFLAVLAILQDNQQDEGLKLPFAKSNASLEPLRLHYYQLVRDKEAFWLAA